MICNKIKINKVKNFIIIILYLQKLNLLYIHMDMDMIMNTYKNTEYI